MEKSLIISIADVKLAIDQINVKIDERYEPFIDKVQYEWKISYRKVDILNFDVGKTVYEQSDYKVLFNSNFGYIWIYMSEWLGNIPYAYSYIVPSTKEVIVNYLKSEEERFNNLNGCLSRSLWEKIMILEKRLILHSSCISTQYGGICFMGVSGIGKSTQSDLWVQYENAKIINGDRPILFKKDLSWRAYGSPYAGSSKIHINESCNIRCIVLLKQATKNSLRKLNAREAFQSVFSNTTMYSYDQEYMNLGLDLVMELIRDIEVFELSCLPDKSAVDLLKESLIGGK